MTPEDNLPALTERLLTHLRTPLEAEIRALNDALQPQAKADRGLPEDQTPAGADIGCLAEAQLEQLRQSIRQLAQTRGDEGRLRDEVDRLERELEDARRAADQAGTERDALQRALDDVRHAAAMASEELGRAAVRTAHLADAVRAIDEAGSIGEVLERLTQTARSWAQRSALFMVKGQRLRSWSTSDFPIAASADVALAEAGLIADAVAQRRPQVRAEGTGEADPALPRFAADTHARDVAALPIVIGGEVVAVLYADTPRGVTGAGDRRWALALEVVVRCVSSRVEAMTLQRSFGWPGAGRMPAARSSEGV